MNRILVHGSLIASVIAAAIFIPSRHPAMGGSEGVYRTVIEADGQYLAIELLDDDLAHFELGAASPTDEPIWTTPMVAKTDYPGPSVVNLPAENIIETSEMRLEIDTTVLCVTITDITREPALRLTTTCPLLDDLTGLSLTQEGTTDLYGLGEYFQRRGTINDNLIGQRRLALNPYGNELSSFNGGNVGNAQFPILYALGAGTENYALFLDHLYHQVWDFREDPFKVQTVNTPLRWYVMTGADLPDLRRDYMELTGHPPVPPKQMFGLWVSEYGYENWDELTGVLESLKAANFPLDGFMLDLQWFGGINPSANSQMGALAWDEENFPDPAGMIAQLREEYGLGIMTIEEPYVSQTALGYEDALAKGALARECPEVDCPPILMNEWWGNGGMVDWTNPDASAWWHDERRQHLIDEGVIGHWTDLGEPEAFDDIAWYYGFPEFERHEHADIHNIYNLLWSKSIWDGYQRNGVERRPFSLSRSGTAGTQRYGVAMWSGDIASNIPSLAGHMNAQMQMSLSGIDYFGSDIGGFRRDVFDPLISPDDLYTRWLANAALLDIPLRPHASNLQNAYATAPSLIGDVASNLANVRLRYELSPYLYTLAHRAYCDGEPLFAPLVYYFQTDPNVRKLGSQKMIGPDMMMATTTEYEAETVAVYLPAGGWFNYHTHEYINSTGEWIDTPTTIDGVFRAPLFVREGAIIPHFYVDEASLNMLGQREDDSFHNDLILNTYGQAGNFTMIEDDGETMAYQNGAVRETTITYAPCDAGWCLEVSAVGTYENAPEQRNVEVRLVAPETPIAEITLNGEVLPHIESSDALQTESQGWALLESGLILVKSGVVDVATPLQFVFAAE